MATLQRLSVVAVRQLVVGACRVVGSEAGGHAAEKVTAFLVERFTDESQRLTKALQNANERAWKAFEIALGGNSLWERCKRALVSAEDKAFREQVRSFLAQSYFTGLSAKEPDFFEKALEQLRAARSRGSLLGGQVFIDQLAREAGGFARFDNPQAEIDAEWILVGQIAAELKETSRELYKLVKARPHDRQSPSLLAIAVRYYFRREVEADPKLFHCLAFAKLEAIQDAQEKAFAGITDALTQQRERLEGILTGVIEALEKIDTTTADTNARTRLVEQRTEETQQTAEKTHDLVQNMPQQVKDMIEQQFATFSRHLHQALEQLQLQNREVRPSDSMSARSESDQQKVRLVVKEYRALPVEVRQERPELLNEIGKLEVAAGEFEAAQSDFQAAAAALPEPKAKAEAHHNAYLAALERQQWGEALEALKQALDLDPVRFAPFQLGQFQLQRILGAGGFGVVFLCQHLHLRRPVVVKSLLASELDRDIEEVFAEATTLEDLDHPGIIKVRDCGFADQAKTRPYLVMHYFDGMNLSDYVANQGPLSPEDLLAIAQPVAEALQVAHDRGILHRDVKPANLLVRRDSTGWQVKLIDFGLALRPSALEAKASTQHQAKTAIGRSIAGTLEYAAPEQMGRLPGAQVGACSDVYGFGKTCYYALLGTPDPDDGEKEVLPENWRGLLSKCTRRALVNRLPNFAAVLAELKRVREGGPSEPQVPKTKPNELVPGELESVKQPDLGQGEECIPADERVEEEEGIEEEEGTATSFPTLVFRNKGLAAQGYETAQGFVVQAGGLAVRETVSSVSEQLIALRATLLKQGVLVEEGDHLKLTQDYTFSSSSTAASVLAGGARSGPENWKDSQGTKLRDLQKRPEKPEPGPLGDSIRQRARTYLARGKFSKAIASFDKLLKLEPKVPANHLERGRAHASAGNYDKAIWDFGQVILLGVRSAEVFIARGCVYAAKGQRDLAFADFDSAYQLDPTAGDLYYERGKVRLSQEAFDQALADFSEGARLCPNDVRFLNARGRVFLLQGKVDEALAEFIQASQRDPHCVEAYLNRAQVWITRGEDRQALTDLTQAIQFEPRCAAALASRARARVRLGQTGLALADFNKAIKLRPHDATLYLERGLLLHDRDEIAAAIEDFQAAIKLDRGSALAYKARGVAYMACGKYGRAVSDFTRALELDSSRTEVLTSRARAHLLKKQFDQAEVDASEAIRLGVDVATAYHVRGCTHLEMKVSDRAIADLTEALRLNSQNPDGWNDRGRAYLLSGENANAVSDFTAAIRLNGKVQDYYLNRSRAYARYGDKENAQADKEKANSLSPRSTPNTAGEQSGG